MNDLKLGLLSVGEVLGEQARRADKALDQQLEVMKNYGLEAEVTDLCVLTGGYKKNPCFWTLTEDGYGDVLTVSSNQTVTRSKSSRDLVIRPTLKSHALISQILAKGSLQDNLVYEVELGEYPQKAIDLEMQKDLEYKYSKQELNKTGATYTFDSRKMEEYEEDFTPVTYEEYEYQGKKYVRVMSNGSSFDISNGQDVYVDGDFVWVEVSPVEWLVDLQSEQLIAKKGILSGIKFNSWDYKHNFVVTDMYRYINKYLLHDLFQGLVLKENIDLTPRVVTDAFSYEENSNRSR